LETEAPLPQTEAEAKEKMMFALVYAAMLISFPQKKCPAQKRQDRKCGKPLF